MEDKASLYGVIVSNAVLFWMKEYELEKTTVSMFNVLKSGGIAAHNLAPEIQNIFTLQKVGDDNVQGLLEILQAIKRRSLQTWWLKLYLLQYLQSVIRLCQNSKQLAIFSEQ